MTAKERTAHIRRDLGIEMNAEDWEYIENEFQQAVAEEREACAKVADYKARNSELASRLNREAENPSELASTCLDNKALSATEIAAAIRSRGPQ